MESATKLVTCTAPVNIAVIKYCEFFLHALIICGMCISPTTAGGKRDETLILPINSSLSVTLSQDDVNWCQSVASLEFQPLCIEEGSGGSAMLVL